ncbi:MAG: 50S ribosomal protein L23 [Acidobacteria bacterium]|nr:MAG: 50S ribosomal protein L23 [Acidobacteriota bacterium]REK07135.1 MAG: 50S ribosomal protein L23 [Acidobacteriota bacterium]
MRIQDVIIRPLITEKSTVQRELQNIVAFRVDARANKIEIKRAVEEQFKKDNVKVADVRVARVHGKVRRQGRFVGRRPDWKKAYVRLAEGNIEFFEGA